MVYETVNAEAYIVDQAGTELASISVTTALPVALTLVENFLAQHKNLPASKSWKGAYNIEIDGIIYRASSMVDLHDILVFMTYY